jgi:hypothetical protein
MQRTRINIIVIGWGTEAVHVFYSYLHFIGINSVRYLLLIFFFFFAEYFE